jgi:hypothetical protein
MPSESGGIARQRGQFVPATRHNLPLGINRLLPISGEVAFIHGEIEFDELMNRLRARHGVR